MKENEPLQDDPIHDQPMPLIDHLLELRTGFYGLVRPFWCVLRSVTILRVIFTSFWRGRWARSCGSRVSSRI